MAIFSGTFGRGGLRQLVIAAMVGNEALQRRHVHGVVHVGARAGGGAGVRADAAADRGNRVFSHNELQRLVEESSSNHGHVALCVAFGALMDGACGLVARSAAARNRKDVWDGLREWPVDRLPLSQPLIELGGHSNWTYRRASAATSAFRRVNETRLLLDCDSEIPRLPVDALHLSQGENVNVLAPADFHQTRRHGTHGAIVGGKSLVQLRHDPANGRAALGQIHLDAAVGEIKRRLHAADTASNHQGSTRLAGFWIPQRAWETASATSA